MSVMIVVEKNECGLSQHDREPKHNVSKLSGTKDGETRECTEWSLTHHSKHGPKFDATERYRKYDFMSHATDEKDQKYHRNRAPASFSQWNVNMTLHEVMNRKIPVTPKVIQGS